MGCCELDARGWLADMRERVFGGAAFGIRRRPNYAILRGTAGDFTYGSNFAAYGGSARPVKVWNTGEKFTSPFSLDVQQQWFQRYKIRLWFYESPVYNPNGRLVQSLPKLSSVNSSLFTVWAGYQDYFWSLYEKKLTVSQTRKIVPEVVKAIEEHIEKILAVVEYTPPGFPTMLMPPATEVLIQNQLPLGCVPALLTVHGGSHAKYDEYGCLSDLNKISKAHNKLLGEKVEALRKKYPAAKLYYGDVYGVYEDILKKPADYSEYIHHECEAWVWGLFCVVGEREGVAWEGVGGVEFLSGDEILRDS